MTIDWSKQPEGFPIWIETNDGIGGGWHRDDGYRYTAQDLTYWTKPADGYYIVHTRPAWTGEGLPPVGTACEVERGGEWIACDVIAHFQQEAAPVAVFTFSPYSGNQKCKELDYYTAESFRPARTQEQIAAEEREAGITQMREVAGSLNTHPFAELWDAGYRKQVAT